MLNMTEVSLKLPNEEIEKIRLKKETTIGNLKIIVHKRYSPIFLVPSKIMFVPDESTGLILDDNVLVSGKWRENGNTLNVFYEDNFLRICIKWEDKYIHLKCSKGDPIRDIKYRIKKIWEIQSGNINLYLNTDSRINHLKQLEDDDKLGEKGLANGSLITLIL